MNLKERWSSFVEAPHVDWTWRMIETLYSEPHRAYHNLSHIEACFKTLDQLRALCRDYVWSADKRLVDLQEVMKDVELAIFFHDIVYVPGDKRNEDLSADLLRALAHVVIRFMSTERAAVAIRATKNHETIADDLLSQITIDVDLSILGSSGSDYAMFVHQVRREYGHISDDAWRLGRSTFLTKMLERKVIFQTQWAIDAFEENARDNMKLELMELIRP